MMTVIRFGVDCLDEIVYDAAIPDLSAALRTCESYRKALMVSRAPVILTKRGIKSEKPVCTPKQQADSQAILNAMKTLTTTLQTTTTKRYNEIFSPQVMDVVSATYMTYLRPVINDFLLGSRWEDAMTEYRTQLLDGLKTVWTSLSIFRNAAAMNIALDRAKLALSREDRLSLPLMCNEFIKDLLLQLKRRSDGIKTVSLI